MINQRIALSIIRDVDEVLEGIQEHYENGGRKNDEGGREPGIIYFPGLRDEITRILTYGFERLDLQPGRVLPVREIPLPSLKRSNQEHRTTHTPLKRIKS